MAVPPRGRARPQQQTTPQGLDFGVSTGPPLQQGKGPLQQPQNPWGRPKPQTQMQDSGLHQPQQGTQPTGLLDRLGQTANTPLTFDNAPPIREQPIIQPSTSPVDVPDAREATGRLEATAPVEFLGAGQTGLHRATCRPRLYIQSSRRCDEHRTRPAVQHATRSGLRAVSDDRRTPAVRASRRAWAVRAGRRARPIATVQAAGRSRR